jgi:hypothetical protein
MVRVISWLPLLLLVLILKQSDAAATYKNGELQKETVHSDEDVTNTTELKHNNGEQADNCCVSGHYTVHVSLLGNSYM